MPWAPSTPCLHPGCAALVHTRYCSVHTPPRAPRRDDPEQSRAYGRSWRTLSARVRGEAPICQGCGRAPSSDVDHIDGDRTNNERANLQALCRACHSYKTARFNGGFGNKRRGT